MKLIFALSVAIMLTQAVAAQDKRSQETGPIRSSAAYSEILLRRTELQADLEAYLADYTESNPKILDIRAELKALDAETDKVFAVKASETDKLTLALGRLIVRKAELEADLARLLRTNSKDHPEVKRAQRRVEIFDSAIREVLH